MTGGFYYVKRGSHGRLSVVDHAPFAEDTVAGPFLTRRLAEDALEHEHNKQAFWTGATNFALLVMIVCVIVWATG